MVPSSSPAVRAVSFVSRGTLCCPTLAALDARRQSMDSWCHREEIRPFAPMPNLLRPAIGRRWPPWRWSRPPGGDIPGMITVEEARYYAWLGRSFRGVGEVVEIGSWLGRSTVCLMSGLARNPAFAGRRLHVVDDFIWRSDWMDAYVTEPPPPHGASFRPLFDRYTAAIADRLAVETRKVCDYAGNEHLPGLEWSGAAIELLVVDCGRTLAANEGWWRVLSASFLPSTTLVVMQDWQTWRETPVKPYNQTR